MLRPRWYKVLADLWSNKLRSLLVIASIAVGLFAVGLITSMHLIVKADLAAGYRAVNPASIQLGATPFDADAVRAIRKLPDVRQAEGVWAFTLRTYTPRGEWKQIDLQAIADLRPGEHGMQINRVQLKQGVWPPGEREIAVDINKLDDLGLRLGDEVEIETSSGLMRRLRLTAVVNDQTIGSNGGGGFFLAPAQGYLTQETLEWLGLAQQMNRLLVTVKGNPDDTVYLRQVANQVSDALEAGGPVVYSTAVRASTDHPNRVYVEALAAVLFVLGFLVVFLSGFLITNTFAALLNQQEHQIGVMKTIGGRQGQIMGVYMVLIFIFGLAAFAIALPLSSRATYFLLGFFASAINMQLQGYRMVPEAAILELAIALIVPQAAGFLPILHGTRISAVEALSGYSQSSMPRVQRWRARRWMSRPLLLSLRNTFRRRGRLALTLFTLTLGGAIFIGTFNVQRSLTNYIARIGRYFSADVNLTLKSSARIDQVEPIMLSVPGVRAVEGWAASAGKLILPDGSTGETVQLLAPPSISTLVQPTLLEGRWVIPGDRNVVVVNERLRESIPNLKVGDKLRLKIGEDEVDLVVVGFFQLAGKSGGYLGYTTYEYLAPVTHAAGRATLYRISGDRPGLTLAEQLALGQALEDRLEARGFNVADVEPGRRLTATTADGLNILTTFLLIMALLIALVGSIGLTGTMSLNVLERTREIGILRAIGASDGNVTTLVMVEGMLIGLMSWLFGVLLAIPISLIMSNAINLALFGAAAEFEFTPTGVILWLGIVLVLSVFASVGPARNATRLTIREVLAYE